VQRVTCRWVVFGGVAAWRGQTGSAGFQSLAGRVPRGAGWLGPGASWRRATDRKRAAGARRVKRSDVSSTFQQQQKSLRGTY
jgi:hypothetical protein